MLGVQKPLFPRNPLFPFLKRGLKGIHPEGEKANS